MRVSRRPVRDPSLVDAVVPLITLAVLIALKDGHTWEEGYPDRNSANG